ncbi:DNA phosphorothioation-associated protein 4 [Nocardiopsis sp. FIRDI 009]|uniref:DNA phosphorothioation-associated protein 4 n=1 Tax=Nocardiopsis sp. FIRDI 009 TaxID=714197 RepID=UPI000E22D471|nr:DNA phosphorothioation-associated protein 4 [Nocardiopsis sp. FIRDI 009]
MPTTDRFRRPKDHEQLLNDLKSEDGPFDSRVDALIFAAALGRRKNLRDEFKESGERIRLELIGDRQYGDVLIYMLAAIEKPDDPEILADDRLDERILIFEEYANGGLNYLQGELNRSATYDLDVLVSGLVMDALRTYPSEEDEVGELMSDAGLDW